MSHINRSICLSCRLQLWSQLRGGKTSFARTAHTASSVAPSSASLGIRAQRSTSRRAIPTVCVSLNRRNIASNTDWPHSAQDTEQQPQDEGQIPQDEHINPEDEALYALEEEELSRTLARAALDPQAVAQHARQRFGDRLPEGALTTAEQAVYERLYGKPLAWSEEHEMTGEELHALKMAESPEGDGLLKEGHSGQWEEIQGALDRDEMQEEEYDEEVDLDAFEEQPDDIRLREDIEAQMSGQGLAVDEQQDNEADQHQRSHPFTIAARSGTYPSTLPIPKDAIAGPTAVLLSDVSNKHLDEAAERLFGGKGLPYGIGTPGVSKQMTQKPMPLTASQSRMTPMEANVFMAALAPGIYASVTSALVEVRKRLGTAWIEALLAKDGGPKVLDAGAGGIGILAWREIVSAEWSRMQSNVGAIDPATRPAAPLGKATVLTGSEALRLRASILLENTTFLPRLPDYMHVQDPTSEQRKGYDIIIAPYSLWHIKEDHLRKQHVENLWRLLSPSGGVLILLEKGVPRGFEVIAGARQHLLQDLFAPALDSGKKHSDDPRRNFGGTIIAPCTNHAKCPMYPVPGVSRQRKDYCHFSQRYVRPVYYQRMLGAKSRNHDEVRYSYIAVQKGPSPNDTNEPSTRVPAPLTGEDATQRALAGYDVHDEDLRVHAGSAYQGTVTIDRSPDASHSLTTPPPETAAPHPSSLPRLVLPPLKRHGHVIMDVCTPAGTLERWTVARSFGRQAYRDARKARWGDLWALGAKQRVARRVKLGLAKADEADEAQRGDDGEGPLSKSKERVEKRKQEKLRGREKARTRRRQEKAEFGT